MYWTLTKLIDVAVLELISPILSSYLLIINFYLSESYKRPMILEFHSFNDVKLALEPPLYICFYIKYNMNVK